jgi:hypothetical protein
VLDPRVWRLASLGDFRCEEWCSEVWNPKVMEVMDLMDLRGQILLTMSSEWLGSMSGDDVASLTSFKVTWTRN